MRRRFVRGCLGACCGATARLSPRALAVTASLGIVGDNRFLFFSFGAEELWILHSTAVTLCKNVHALRAEASRHGKRIPHPLATVGSVDYEQLKDSPGYGLGTLACSASGSVFMREVWWQRGRAGST